MARQQAQQAAPVNEAAQEQDLLRQIADNQQRIDQNQQQITANEQREAALQQRIEELQRQAEENDRQQDEREREQEERRAAQEEAMAKQLADIKQQPRQPAPVPKNGSLSAALDTGKDWRVWTAVAIPVLAIEGAGIANAGDAGRVSAHIALAMLSIMALSAGFQGLNALNHYGTRFGNFLSAANDKVQSWMGSNKKPEHKEEIEMQEMNDNDDELDQDDDLENDEPPAYRPD